jgi:hypothetical protein
MPLPGDRFRLGSATIAMMLIDFFICLFICNFARDAAASQILPHPLEEGMPQLWRAAHDPFGTNPHICRATRWCGCALISKQATANFKLGTPALKYGQYSPGGKGERDEQRLTVGGLARLKAVERDHEIKSAYDVPSKKRKQNAIEPKGCSERPDQHDCTGWRHPRLG